METERANMLRIIHYAARHEWLTHASLLPHVLAQFLDSWGYWEDAATAHRLAVRSWQEMRDYAGRS